MLMEMFLQEFEFLLAKIERMCLEEGRKRLSKRPRQRGIRARHGFSPNLRLDSQLAPRYKIVVISKPLTHGFVYRGSRLRRAHGQDGCCRRHRT